MESMTPDLLKRIGQPPKRTLTTIRVRNLAPGTSLDNVIAAFSDFGEILDCVLKQRYHGQLLQVSALILFESEAQAAHAIREMDGAVADGQILVVELKANKNQAQITTTDGAAQDVGSNAAELSLSHRVVPTTTVAEICSVSPAVSDGVKKWVLRRRVEVGPEELKVHSGTLVEGREFKESEANPCLYSCLLGYLTCLIGAGESAASPLIDSGSQLNIISDSMANQFNLTPRGNFSSAVYGINNQACELIGVAEDVPVQVGKSIVGYCHFWITRQDSPFILGRLFLMDFKATLLCSPLAGERIILPDSEGQNIEFSLCPVEKGRWEREFPAHRRKGCAHPLRARHGVAQGSGAPFFFMRGVGSSLSHNPCLCDKTKLLSKLGLRKEHELLLLREEAKLFTPYGGLRNEGKLHHLRDKSKLKGL
ncbi:hypothetical protein PTTG_28390 [Puccinia triticina 1-1 BBBD Race 1]|uniref:RRM domain-containing protein n=1 Tax=Puccinia triticina (isolate 1-1 / race 1 (BBBD)) TaxID=630390 RepID=A0A180GC77_PUCT1|nr:hypothetical protein PTTG_28390 [Puccinia triticina 1-1 BBBD Race 1]